MFEELRKKISGVIKGITKKEKEEAKAEAEVKAEEGKAAANPENIVGVKEEHKEAKEPAAPKPEIGESLEKPHAASQAHHRDEKHGKLLNVSITSRIKAAFAGPVTLGDKEVSDFVEKMKISFLEADVSYDVAEELADSLRSSLKDMKVYPSNADAEFVDKVRESMLSLLSNTKKGIDLEATIQDRIRGNEVPVKILFLGPNGTGKTTTIAKIAYMLKHDGISCVISASDTFRAAAIEQTEHHANKVGVPVVKSTYGADPASVAFDAIAHAKSHGINVVLIDSAGRQETNKNLINEVQKIVRVAKPDITIFVAESTAGSALVNQIREFTNVAKIDGIILTKLDCDAKGGNALSIAKETGIPILFFGTGESYTSLIKFDPQFLVDNILPKAS